MKQSNDSLYSDLDDSTRRLILEAFGLPLASPDCPIEVKIKIDKRGGKARRVPHIDARDVIRRAIWAAGPYFEVFYTDRTTDDSGRVSICCQLTIAGVTRSDYGIGEARAFGGAEKAAASDALKRAAVHFGLAIELYGEDADSYARMIAEDAEPAPEYSAQAEPSPMESAWPSRPWPAKTLRQYVNGKIKDQHKADPDTMKLVDTAAAKRLAMNADRFKAKRDDQIAVFGWLLSRPINSFKDLTRAEFDTLYRWIGTAESYDEFLTILNSDYDAATEAAANQDALNL